jgi:hypothetical protein
MYLDDPFPIDAVSSRARAAILSEFRGRCPSIREMTQIPDKQWLATPGIGSVALGAIRSVADDQSSNSVTSSSIDLTDAELLACLKSIQKELQGIRTLLKGRTVRASRIS